MICLTISNCLQNIAKELPEVRATQTAHTIEVMHSSV